MGLISKGQYGDWFIYHTNQFEDECKEAGSNFVRFQSVWSQLRLLITSDPSQNGKVGIAQDGIMVFAGDSENLLPKIRIRYRYGNLKVVMIGLDCSMAVLQAESFRE
jgi:hypothetical protein